MANGWGGSRTPGSPAPVSGPGAGSARTDGGVLNPKEPEYGERQALENLSASAPMGAAPSGVSAPAGGMGDMLAGLVGLGEPTANPGQPVTDGAPLGPGAGPEVLGLPGNERREDARALGPAYQALIAAATREDATPSFKRLVRSALYA